ncbi:uncharacterized protein LOC124911854 [Impatiens glandulifera]|uniref:uncharacterized protein LOC124911854 n=1 Tax=Impatiens glandulifera TaxID=253017 RepID=UPI001FB06083|nr:uncharacterized protein LOC124911854 [Impatiens glandulifera]
MPSDNKEVIFWRMVDATVRTWIMNTIDKKNNVHFQSTLTSQQLWDEIKACYEGNNGPTQYQLRKNIYTIQQGDLDLEEYYSRTMLYWAELIHLQPHRNCTCYKINIDTCVGCKLEKQVIMDYENINLYLFLLGLDDSFENIKDSILMMDPLPNVYKAFTMLLNVEKKKQINIQNHQHHSTMFVNSNGGLMKKTRGPDDGRQNNKNTVCNHCRMRGHIKEQCFRILGYPEWWENSKIRNAVYAANTPFFDDEDAPVEISQ